MFAGATIVGLVVDPVANKLYFSLYYQDKIDVINVDGTGRKTLINTIGNPKRMDIDVNQR